MASDSIDEGTPVEASRQSLPPKHRPAHQTVCDEPGEKDDPCFGHLKRFEVAGDVGAIAVPAGEALFRCNRCYRLYQGEPMAFLRPSPDRSR